MSDPPRWTEKVQASASILGLLGLAFIGWQIYQSNVSLHASTHERLLRHNLEVLRLIVENPETRPYFYEGRKANDFPADEQLRWKVETICEAFTELPPYQRAHPRQLPQMPVAFLVDLDLLRLRRGYPVSVDQSLLMRPRGARISSSVFDILVMQRASPKVAQTVCASATEEMIGCLLAFAGK